MVKLKLRRIHHAAIICSDYPRSRRFYVETLGLPVLSETLRANTGSRGNWTWACRMAAQIELFSFPSPPQRVSRPEACGLRHLSFAVSDIDAAVRALQDQGVDVEAVRVDELTGRRYTFFADPDDLPLELYEE